METPTSQIADWDWEEVALPPSSPSSAAVHGGHHGGVIQSDYFSPDYAEGVVEDEEGKGSESDNPSWVDPTDIPVAAAAVDSGGSVSSDEDSGGRSLIEPHAECCDCGHGLGFGEIGENSGGVEELGFAEEEEKENEEKEVEEKKVVVWWKVPLEVIKYCVFRVSPVWSLSMAAAALMGFVILRRKYLHKLKRKALGIHLNVAVDDKKVSQFMSRAARLNEAFSVVKRVPIIRPALPAPGMAPWPAMSMR